MMRKYLGLFFLLALPCAAQNPILTEQPVSQTVVAGQTATFTFAATGAKTYQWFVNGAKVAGATGTSYSVTASAPMAGETLYAVASNGSAGATQTNNVQLFVTPDGTPDVTAQEDFGVIEADVIANGFGLNVTSNVDSQFQAAAALGAKWVRFDCPWSSVESVTGTFSLPAGCAAGMASAKKYGLRPIIVAYWGPPYKMLGTSTTVGDTPIGSTSLTLSSPITGIVAGQSTLLAGGTVPTQWSLYEGGSLVAATSGNTIVLAMKTNRDIAADTSVTVSLLLYPPVLLNIGSTTTNWVENISVQAFDNYAHYLAQQIAANDGTGVVELWNEPENESDCWDWAPDCYSNSPPTMNIRAGVGMAIPLSVPTISPVAGVKYANGWSDKTGFDGIFSYPTYIPASISDAQQAYAWDSIHPYGNDPEQANWIPACVKADSYPRGPNIYFNCTPIGDQVGANFKIAASVDDYPANQGGIPLAITETGISRNASGLPTETSIARFVMRQFLAYEGDGVNPIIYFRMGGATSFNWLDANGNPEPEATAMQGFLQDVSAIAAPPVPPYTLPQVEAYSGYWPLAHIAIVGSHAGKTALMLVAWQKTYAEPAVWYELPSPPAVPLTVTVPAGMTVEQVKDLVTGAEISFIVGGGTVTYAVADNPVELEVQ